MSSWHVWKMEGSGISRYKASARSGAGRLESINTLQLLVEWGEK